MSDPKIGSRSGALRALLAGGASALAFLSVVPTAAHAQEASQAGDTEASEEDEIVVVGIRAALRSAQEIKREADTVVDTITATDIGAFPDHSVAEALQRVPGITVTRFAASSDTTHFSAEPAGVIVRGLPQVRSEFNGRDSFNANSSRGLSFADVSPELMSGVDTYKNQTADMIEGGIAGTINLRTRVPFDTDGQLFAFSTSAIYRDLPEEATPAISGIWSDRWDTRAGEFGLMANAAYSSEITNSEGVQLWRFYRVDGVYSPGTNWFPGGADIRRTEYDRERTGLAFAAQWESPEDTLLATLQFNRSEYNNSFEERSLTAIRGDSQQPQDLVLTSAVGTTPTGADPYEFDSRGVFLRGTIAEDANGWAGDSANPAFQHPNGFGGNQAWFCHTWAGDPACPTTRGVAISADTRFNDNESITQDTSFNLRWTPNDRLSFNFDVQQIQSEVHNYDNSTSSKTFGDLFLDISGEHPYFEISPSAGFPLTAGGFADPRNYFHEWTMEHFEDSEGTELAVRADAEYTFDTDWIESLRIGVRRAEREQDINYSTYNWGSITPLWGVPAGVGFFVTQSPWNSQTVEPHDLGSNILGGGVFNGGVFFHPRMSMVRDYASTVATFDGNSNTWIPLAQRGCIADPGSLYCPSEQLEVAENTNAAYIRLDLGGPGASIGGMEVRANIGVRYVQTEVDSAGAVQFPLIVVPSPADCAVAVPDERCVTLPQDVLFSNEGFFPTTSGRDHEHWLPSFNLRLGVAEDQYLRFAISRAMARPDMGLYKSFIGIGASDPSCLNTTYTPACAPGQVDPLDAQVPISYTPTYSADIGNPALAPTTADQVDLTYEWYFSDVGFFSVALFYKQFYDYIQQTSFTQEFTNNGVTRTVELTAPINGDGASLQGIEVAFQTFFDFLPDPWSNFGVQANVTYVENEGVSNPNLSNTGVGGGTGGESSFVTFTGFPLEGMSDWAYNIVGMYESERFTARLAYNWRSEFLVSQADCCIKLPIWQDAYGQLDGSVQYRFNDRLAFTFEAQNLLDEETVLTQQVNQEGLRLPRSWFRSGRRFELRMRYQM